MEVLANEIYDILMDMDFADYNNPSEDVEALVEDLKLLQNKGNGALLEAIRLLIE